MGAIFFRRNCSNIPEQVLAVFHRKGFQDPREIKAGTTTVFYFPKQIAEYQGIAERNGITVIASGTCFYKDLPPPESLDGILKDINEDAFSTTQLRGNFLLMILKSNEEISLCIDRIGQYSVYFHNESQTLSSSFLAVLAAAGSMKRLPLNRTNITEVLLTGTGFGEDTMVTDVNRLIPGNEDKASFVNVLRHSKGRAHDSVAVSSIEKQLEVLRTVFSNYSGLFGRTGVISGLTGGLDSRLLFLLLREQPVKLETFTNTYDESAPEYTCAAHLAEAAGAEYRTLVPDKPWEMESSEYRKMAVDGLYFWDGVPRIHHLWIEKRKSRSHLVSLYDNCVSGVSGVGGERFRIHDGMASRRYPVKSWIDNELLGYCGKNALTGEKGLAFRAGFHKKIRTLAGIEHEEKITTLETIRRFYDNVYNTSNRTFRASIENQLVFFLSPFVEPDISVVSMNLIRKTGNLEAELINRLAPGLGHVRTSYGYSPREYASSRDTLLRLLKSRALFSSFHFLKNQLRKGSGILREKMLSRHSFHRGHIERVERLGLPIDINWLADNSSLFPILLQTGMFLEEMEEYLNAD